MTDLIVDGNNVAMRAIFAGKQAEMSYEGVDTGAVVIFFNMVSKAVRDFGVDRMLVCFDGSDGARLRRSFYPEYKANRKKADTADERHRERLRGLAFGAIQSILMEMGVRVVVSDGCEADDLIADATIGATDAYILSGDKDLLQLVSPAVKVVRPQTGGFEVWDEGRVTESFGIPPDRISQYLALVGDASDNVPGVPGYGPKKSVKVIRQDMEGRNMGFAAGVLPLIPQQHRQIATLSWILVHLDPMFGTTPQPFPTGPSTSEPLLERLRSLGLSRLHEAVTRGTIWRADPQLQALADAVEG